MEIQHGEREDVIASKRVTEAPLYVAVTFQMTGHLEIQEVTRKGGRTEVTSKSYCNLSLFLHPWTCPHATWEGKGKNCGVKTMRHITAVPLADKECIGDAGEI